MRSPPQHALAVDRVRWQGEPVVAVVANSRAEAEDAAAMVEVEYEALPAVVDSEAALAPGAEVIHPEFDDNLVFENTIDAGDVDGAIISTPRLRSLRAGRGGGVCIGGTG